MPDKNRLQRYIDHQLSDIDTEIDVVDTVVDAIKLKTDALPTDPADQSLVETAITTAHTTTDGKVDVIDGYHDVPGADVATNLQIRDVVGNKTDTVAGTSLVALAKAVKAKTDNLPVDPADESALEALIAVIDGYHDVPGADVATNLQIRDVVGNKTDTVAGTSLVALVKQIIADTGGTSTSETHTVTVAHGTVEQTIATIAPGRTGPFEFQLDVNALEAAVEGGTVTLRLKHKIDATTARTVDLATYIVGTDTIHPSVNAMVKEGASLVVVTLQVSSAVTVNRACPYIYMQG